MAESTHHVRWLKHRAACELWKVHNRERYLRVKRECAARPGYLARRREMYRTRRARPLTESGDLSTSQTHDVTTTTEIRD